MIISVKQGKIMLSIPDYQAIVGNQLEAVCEVLHMTSVWLVKHNFQKRFSMVVAYHSSNRANDSEQEPDIGESYPEGIESPVWQWLRSANTQPFVFDVDDLSQEFPLDKAQYLPEDVKTIICFKLFEQETLWGFVEGWDTQQKRVFTPDELLKAKGYVKKVESVLFGE
jgi:GAF domain-containing protein